MSKKLSLGITLLLVALLAPSRVGAQECNADCFVGDCVILGHWTGQGDCISMGSWCVFRADCEALTTHDVGPAGLERNREVLADALESSERRSTVEFGQGSDSGYAVAVRRLCDDAIVYLLFDEHDAVKAREQLSHLSLF